MKLRIKGNTIRVRLTQTEVEKLAQGKVEEITTFPNGRQLNYRIEKANCFDVTLIDATILIKLPKKEVEGWEGSDKVEISTSIKLTEEDTLEVSIEKDFKCLTERPSEDETDMYPNPLESHSKC